MVNYFKAITNCNANEDCTPTRSTNVSLPIGSSVAQSTDKACKQDALVNLKVQSAQPTLSYRVCPSLGTACRLGNPLKAPLRPLKEGQCRACWLRKQPLAVR